MLLALRLGGFSWLMWGVAVVFDNESTFLEYFVVAIIERFGGFIGNKH